MNPHAAFPFKGRATSRAGRPRSALGVIALLITPATSISWVSPGSDRRWNICQPGSVFNYNPQVPL